MRLNGSLESITKHCVFSLKAKIAETRGQEAADNFVKKAQTSVKEILGNFKNYDFYLGKIFDEMTRNCGINILNRLSTDEG